MSAPPLVRSEAWLRRYARQVVLPRFGEDGQARLGEASALVVGSGGAAESCALHLVCAGVGAVRIAGPDAERVAKALEDLHRGARVPWSIELHEVDTADVAVVVADGRTLPRVAARTIVRVEDGGRGGARIRVGERPVGTALAASDAIALAAGALAADAALRALLGHAAPRESFVVHADGTVTVGEPA